MYTNIDKKTVAPRTEPNPTMMPFSIASPRNFQGRAKIFITSMLLILLISRARALISRASSISRCLSDAARFLISFARFAFARASEVLGMGGGDLREF